MTLEVPRRPVGHRRKWPVVALVGVAVLIVAVGALWPEGSPDGAPADAVEPVGPIASAAAVTTDLAAAERSRAAASEPVRRSRAWPVPVRPVCRDVEPVRCQRVADAVLDLLESNGTGIAAAVPRVVSLTVWRSLICGDSLDCPTSRLTGSTSLGSAVLRFAGSTGALWVNVVGEAAADGAPAGAETTVAWPVRWAP